MAALGGLAFNLGTGESPVWGLSALVVFEICQEPAGLWRIRRSDGLVEAVFRNRRAALRFARHQYPDQGVMIVFGGDKQPRSPGRARAAG